MKEYEYAMKGKDQLSYVIANYICSTCDVVLEDIRRNLSRDGKSNARNFYDFDDRSKLMMLESVQQQVLKTLDREF